MHRSLCNSSSYPLGAESSSNIQYRVRSEGIKALIYPIEQSV